MRERERGDDLRDIDERRAERAGGSPCALTQDEHGGQQQRNEEQDVIESEPDVPDALVHVGHELSERTRGVAADYASFPRGAEDDAAALSVLDKTEQAAVLRIDV